MLIDKKILITGGTGTFGKQMIEKLLQFDVRKIYVFSRDELKQHELKVMYGENNPKISFLIGDIRDKERLYRAFNGIDIVIHAAALKQVPSCEFNPFEAVKTNIIGAQNIVDAAIDCKVKNVIALSTDKAVSPANLYGATKLCQEKIFISGNSYAGGNNTKFSVVRYGNVLGSRGSVYNIFKKVAEIGVKLPITDLRMTRFFLLPSVAVDFVLSSLSKMLGGEIFVPKMSSIKIIDMATCIFEKFKRHEDLKPEFDEIGIRSGEKLHETLISVDEARNTIEFMNDYIIAPDYSWFNYVPDYKENFSNVPEYFHYSSDNNNSWIDRSLMNGFIERVDNG